MNKTQFLEHAMHVRAMIMLAATSNVVYRWGDDLAYKQMKLEDTFEQAKGYLRVYLTEDETEQVELKAKFERCYKLDEHKGFAAEDETKRLVMPIGRSNDCYYTELTKDELQDLGFRLWDTRDRTKDGRTLWLCPLWLAPFIKCGQAVTTIMGEQKTIQPPDRMDMDHRCGLCSWGFMLRA